MEYFPLFHRLAQRSVLVVGGGGVAARKIALLLGADARVTVIAPVLCAEIEHWRSAGRLQVIVSEFVPARLAAAIASHLDDVRLVIAATDDRAVNHAVAEIAERARLPVNVVDDPAASTCIVPAIVDRDPVLVAISTAGSAPVLATELRARIEALLPARLGALARFARRHRPAVQARLPDAVARRRFWLGVLRGNIADTVLAGQEPVADAALVDALASGAAPTAPRCDLVQVAGAGPDDLRLGALRALFATARLMHDPEVAPALLDLARRDAPRQGLDARPATDFAAARLPSILAALTDTNPVTYLTDAPPADIAELARGLAAHGVLTHLW
ncbi:MAG: bifunctional precorrin-2 dehydrogenase/sirohydrochlorin ferrochelatase [Gammaproteobacteria bacterium]